MVLWKRCGSAESHENWATRSLRPTTASRLVPRPTPPWVGPPLDHVLMPRRRGGIDPASQTAAASGGVLLVAHSDSRASLTRTVDICWVA
jgi:hypothetical protein